MFTSLGYIKLLCEGPPPVLLLLLVLGHIAVGLHNYRHGHGHSAGKQKTNLNKQKNQKILKSLLGPPSCLDMLSGQTGI